MQKTLKTKTKNKCNKNKFIGFKFNKFYIAHDDLFLFLFKLYILGLINTSLQTN